jgi:hypothetical protein
MTCPFDGRVSLQCPLLPMCVRISSEARPRSIPSGSTGRKRSCSAGVKEAIAAGRPLTAAENQFRERGTLTPWRAEMPRTYPVPRRIGARAQGSRIMWSAIRS